MRRIFAMRRFEFLNVTRASRPCRWLKSRKIDALCVPCNTHGCDARVTIEFAYSVCILSVFAIHEQRVVGTAILAAGYPMTLIISHPAFMKHHPYSTLNGAPVILRSRATFAQ
ncbi:MAG TPA: hypothetical protein VFC78_17730 [Tepidisphaeraceae bacterium]|nr:hypothetical protein [Tepidisphaeraceae bacterium]